MERTELKDDSSGEMTVFIPSETKNLKDQDSCVKFSDEKEDEEDEREHWTRGLDFILSLIGYAVGVSNLWRFPYLALRNGGGAFLIPYFFFLFMCGIPLFYLEVCLGQFSGISSMFVWKLCPAFKGIGYGMVIVSGMACIYYNAVLSWVIYYLINSFYPDLPWASCDHWWNTKCCVDRRVQGNQTDNTTESIFTQTAQCNDTSKLKTAAEEFWQYNVLRKSTGLDDFGEIQVHSAMCLLAAWILVCLCLVKGVKSLGKVVYVTALLPYLLLTIFLIRGLMLPGALEGIRFYVTPDFEKLKSLTVWVEACVQVFYSLGPAWGGLITMASFNKFNNKCFRDVMIASMADGLTSFYGGFVIFAVVGFMAKESNVSVSEVATQGPGLALVAYPEAIARLPVPQLWSVLFFIMLLSLGLDSQFGMFETVVAGLIDAFPKQLKKKRVWLTFGIAMISFIVSLPVATNAGIYVFTLLDWFVAAFCVMVTSLIECIVIAWIYGVDRFCEDIEMMIGRKPNYFMQICWAVITPIIMLVAFIFTCVKYTLPVYDKYIFPLHANIIGFIISFLPLLPIPLCMAYVIYHRGGSFSQRLCSSFQPDADWGPAPKHLRDEYQLKLEKRRHRPHWFIALFKRIKL
ncbi:sodium- and chloride-dependent glycine transporter 1-like isoform X2 [Biomphalaria glabrata]|nr:sodium- and chloride-dependent glycine transporter 1-like [Biomphalaria glabrata]KAI8790591.1 sodium- and chloride-dependent glycine transporter 1 isoform X2 [Biomphalaria glabrata]